MVFAFISLILLLVSVFASGYSTGVKGYISTTTILCIPLWVFIVHLNIVGLTN